MKFGNILKKELRELFSKQAIITMIATPVLLIAIGQFMGTAMDDITESFSSINVCNLDDSDFTRDLLNKVNESGTNVNIVDIRGEDYAAELERLEIEKAVIIPKGYADSILVDKEPASLLFVNTLGLGGGFFSSVSDIGAADIISSIERVSADEILLQTYGVTEEEIERIMSPVRTTEYTVANGKTAQVESAGLFGLVMSQSLIAPMVIFFLLLTASQMIMTAISTEKIDKTLETLMSTPVSRMTILNAKMLAAVIAAIVNAAVMMVGFAFYMLGITGDLMEEVSMSVNMGTEQIQGALNSGQAMAELGLALSALDYLLFGLQLFLTMAIGLSVSLILGAMATDVKSLQTLIFPIMIAVMAPWLITMFADINAMSPVFRIIIYLVPFTHTYIAFPNLMSGNMALFAGGLVYQAAFFLLCMRLAVKMFTTDRLFTMGINIDASRKKTGFKLGGLMGR